MNRFHREDIDGKKGDRKEIQSTIEIMMKQKFQEFPHGIEVALFFLTENLTCDKKKTFKTFLKLLFLISNGKCQ